MFTSFSQAHAQDGKHETVLTAEDISDVIASYHSSDPKASVQQMRRQMPPPVTDERVRASIMQHLPASLMQLQIKDRDLTERVRKMLALVLSLYNRLEVYEIVVIRHPVPLCMSDSGVVLLITTGMLDEATSEDELLGYVAHEIGHEYFGARSILTRQLLQAVSSTQPELALTRKMAEVLALIELDCDAFAALTLAALKRSPLAFVNGLERTSRNFPAHATVNHPADAVRRSIVSSIVPSDALRTRASQSEALRGLKETLRTQAIRTVR